MLFAVCVPSISMGADDNIDVIRAGREDIGAFDDMLAKSQKTQDRRGVAPARREIFSNVVTSEARKVKEERSRDAGERKVVGDWVNSQKRQDKKGSPAAGEGSGGGTGGASSQSARDKVPGGKGAGKNLKR
jgi:hypothetical protein